MDAKCTSAFSLIEALAAVLIIAVLVALVAPALPSLSDAGNITRSASQLAGALETARAYAMANHTYVWVGFFEEDGTRSSSCPATTGTGRIIISTVASRDGTTIYNINDINNDIVTTLDPSRLIQINDLLRLDGMHLKTFGVVSGTGDSFDTRPAVAGAFAQIGDISPDASHAPFQYPLGSASAQYTFTKAIQFSPRGVTRVNCTKTFPDDNLTQLVEIGMQPLHGARLDGGNVVAVQISGLLGNVKIYRK